MRGLRIVVRRSLDGRGCAKHNWRIHGDQKLSHGPPGAIAPAKHHSQTCGVEAAVLGCSCVLNISLSLFADVDLLLPLFFTAPADKTAQQGMAKTSA